MVADRLNQFVMDEEARQGWPDRVVVVDQQEDLAAFKARSVMPRMYPTGPMSRIKCLG